MVQLKKKDKLYYARIIPNAKIYEVCELIIRTASDTWFVGIDKSDKHVYLFNYEDIGRTVFLERERALSKVLEEEKKVMINHEE